MPRAACGFFMRALLLNDVLKKKGGWCRLFCGLFEDGYMDLCRVFAL